MNKDDKKEEKPAVNSEIKETPVGQENKAEKTPTQIAEELGIAKAEAEKWKKQYETAEPVLKAVYGDPEAYKATNKAYLKMMGIDKPVDNKEDGKENGAAVDKKEEVKKPSATEVDNRNALISNTVKDFEKEHGIDKLTKEEKETLNNAIIGEIKGILDPNETGKGGAELLEGVSVSKLPGVLERAYYLATRQTREKQIKDSAVNQYQNEERGMVGSISQGSGESNGEEVVLTEKEKRAARRMGVSEEKYLKNKTEIAKREGRIY